MSKNIKTYDIAKAIMDKKISDKEAGQNNIEESNTNLYTSEKCVEIEQYKSLNLSLADENMKLYKISTCEDSKLMLEIMTTIIIQMGDNFTCPGIQIYYNTTDTKVVRCFFTYYKHWIKKISNEVKDYEQKWDKNWHDWKDVWDYFSFKILKISTVRFLNIIIEYEKTSHKNVKYSLIEKCYENMHNRLYDALHDSRLEKNMRSLNFVFTPLVDIDSLIQDEIETLHLAFKQLYGDTYMCVSTAPEFYIWDKIDKIWKYSDAVEFETYINQCLRYDLVENKLIDKLENIMKKYDFDSETIKKSKHDPHSEQGKYYIKKLKYIVKRFSEHRFSKTIFSLIKKDKVCPEFLDILDNDKKCIAIKNGLLLNLQTLKVRERTPKDYFTHYFDYNFVPELLKKAETIPDGSINENVLIKFIRETCSHDKKIIRFLQCTLGSCLVSGVEKNSIYILYGPRSENKTILMNMMALILGTYYAEADKCLIINGSKISNGILTSHIKNLNGKRLVSYSGVKYGDFLNDEYLKYFTGVEKTNNKSFPCAPKFKLFILADVVPLFLFGKTMAEKLIAVEIHEKSNFRLDEEDDNIKDVLDLFFTWLAIGGNYIFEHGMYKPKIINDFTTSYIKEVSKIIKKKFPEGFKTDEDKDIQEYLSERTIPSSGFVYGATFYEDYRKWCEKSSKKPLSSQIFGAKVMKTITKKHTKTGNRYINISLKID